MRQQRLTRHILSGLVLALFSLGLTVSALELAARALHLAAPAGSPGWFWRAPDPETGWSLQPGATGRWFNPYHEYDVAVTINGLGLRDVERDAPQKPTGVFRILLLGDSYVEGLRVPLEQTFGKVLEAKLNATAPEGLRFEVIPAGVSGWGTDQQLLWYRQQGAAYQPDLVVLALFPGNDFQNNAEPLEVANMGRVQKPFFHLTPTGELDLRYYPFDPAQAPQTPLDPAPEDTTSAQPARPDAAAADWLHAHSALYRFVAPRLATAAPALAHRLAAAGWMDAAQLPKDVPPDYIPVAYGVYSQPPTAEWQDSFALTSALIEELRLATEATGAPLAVVTMTAPEQVYPERWQRKMVQNPAMQALSWDLEQPNRVAAQIAQQAGLPFLDLLPIFRQQALTSRQPLHLGHDGHWTPAGERLSGVTIADFLISQGLAPTQTTQATQEETGQGGLV
jgi:lysophospholipase L1-like esterase